jgi:NitT/TauT family transport system permease protein
VTDFEYEAASTSPLAQAGLVRGRLSGLRRAAVGAASHSVGLFFLRLASFAVLVGVWQLASGRVIDPFWVSSPARVGQRIGHWTANGYLADQVGATLKEAALGFLVGSAIGILLGTISGYFRLLGKILEPLILAFYSMPAIALAPLFLLWFGIGDKSKIAVSATTVMFIVFFNVYTGLRNVDQELLNIVRILGAKRWHILAKVVTPSTLTYVFLGLKVSLPFALIGAVVAEMVSSTRGIGFVMQSAVNEFDTTGVFVGLVVISTVSVILGTILTAVEHHLLRWKVEK